MGLLKTLFKKDSAEKAQPQVQMQEAVTAKPDTAKPGADTTAKKPKHGEDGVCCGSCQ